jgi:hypothetical protein
MLEENVVGILPADSEKCAASKRLDSKQHGHDERIRRRRLRGHLDTPRPSGHFKEVDEVLALPRIYESKLKVFE